MFNLEDYETVDERIHKFWEKYPNGRIITSDPIIVRNVEGAPLQYVFRCEVYRDISDPVPSATGTAEEIVGSSPVNRTSALENAESSAIGRALANLSFSKKGTRPSQTEMAKVQRNETPPSQREVKAPESDWKSEPVRGTDTVIKDPTSAPSEKQLSALVNKTTKVGINSDFHNQFWQFALAGGQMNGSEAITKGEASQLIGMDKEDFAGYGASFFAQLLESETDAPF